MKRIVVLLVVVFLCAILAHAGDIDWMKRSLLEDGGELNSEEIDSILNLPRELTDILTAGSNPIIIPEDIAIFNPEWDHVLILHIRDSIKTTKYRMGNAKK